MKNSINSLLINIKKKTSRNYHADSKQEALVKYGREQFKKLVEKGLTIPVVLL